MDRLPAGRTVVQFVVEGTNPGEAWLVLDRGESTACTIDPGFDVDLVVMGDNRELHRWLLGWRSLRDLQRAGEIRLIGPSRLVRAFSGWFGAAPFARSLGRGTPQALAG